MKILIAGWPKVGKTTFASSLLAQLPDSRVRHTDDLIGTLEWSAASLEVSRWIDEPGPWIIEGVSVPRALRKWLERSPGLPADIMYWSSTPRIPLNPGQSAMGKGCNAVWDVVREELVRRGLEIRYF